MPENNEQGKKQYRIGSVERSEEKNDHLKQIKSKLYKNDLLSTFCLKKSPWVLMLLTFMLQALALPKIVFLSLFLSREVMLEIPNIRGGFKEEFMGGQTYNNS